MPTQILFSPSRYVQGPGVLSQLGEHVSRIGSSPLIVAGETAWQIAEGSVNASFATANLPVKRVVFGKLCTAAIVDDLARQIAKGNHDVLIGVGGGSVIDAAKAAGHLAGIRWASVPTTASSDAPTSALSVMYTADGAFEEYRFFPSNPHLVLIDSEVVANAPVEFLVGGIGDALATWLEARATARGQGMTMAGGRPTLTATALAELSWRLLHDNALLAIDAVRAKTVTPALEAVIEANTLLSGLGFESGGLAAAHAIHNGLTAAPQTHGLTHGQKVNIGSITQLILEGAPVTEIEDFIVFSTRVGLPNTLTEVGLSPEHTTELRAVAKAATAEGETIHAMPFPVNAQMVYDALVSIEAISRRVRAESGLPEPVARATHAEG